MIGDKSCRDHVGRPRRPESPPTVRAVAGERGPQLEHVGQRVGRSTPPAIVVKDDVLALDVLPEILADVGAVARADRATAGGNGVVTKACKCYLTLRDTFEGIREYLLGWDIQGRLGITQTG